MFSYSRFEYKYIVRGYSLTHFNPDGVVITISQWFFDLDRIIYYMISGFPVIIRSSILFPLVGDRHTFCSMFSFRVFKNAFDNLSVELISSHDISGELKSPAMLQFIFVVLSNVSQILLKLCSFPFSGRYTDPISICFPGTGSMTQTANSAPGIISSAVVGFTDDLTTIAAPPRLFEVKFFLCNIPVFGHFCSIHIHLEEIHYH